MDYKRAAAKIAGIVPRSISEKQVISVSRAFTLANSAYRVANLDQPNPVAANVTYESAPEYESIESFVEYKMDDEEDEFDHEDLVALAYQIKSSPGKIRKELEDFGLSLKERAKEKKPRGFQSPNHDRWYGPGSSPTHGGSGSGTKWIPSAQ